VLQPLPQATIRSRLREGEVVVTGQEPIRVGDLVRFKGGGSTMTVESIEGEEATCTFLLGGRQRLPLAALERVPEEPHWWDPRPSPR